MARRATTQLPAAARRGPAGRAPAGPAPRRACAALLWCALSGGSLLGCAAGSSAGPREALRAYALALREQRVSDAYALLGRDARARVSFPEFSRMVAENGREIEDISASLLEP